MYKTGESGYLDIPTDAEHNGWATGLNFNVKGVTFKMIPVDWGDKSFLIGETEVTEGLYYAVTDGTTTTPNKPIVNISYDKFKDFMSKLNAMTSLVFRYPSLEEWQYAAKGGSKSLGFTYSGSNTPGDVAWFVGNCSTMQNVKQKQPNELGIYDMSGNAWEWTSTKPSNYYAYSFYACGGCYSNQESRIIITSTYYNSTDRDYKDSNIGIRLALTLK